MSADTLMTALFMGTVISRQANDIGYDLRLDTMDSAGRFYVTGIFDGDIPNGARVRCKHGPTWRTWWHDQPTIVEWWVNPPRREGIRGKISRLGKKVSGGIVRFRGR